MQRFLRHESAKSHFWTAFPSIDATVACIYQAIELHVCTLADKNGVFLLLGSTLVCPDICLHLFPAHLVVNQLWRICIRGGLVGTKRDQGTALSGSTLQLSG